MDAFYEESAVNANAKKEGKKYKFLHILSRIFLVLAVVLLVMCVMWVPVDAEKTTLFMCVFCGIQGGFFLLMWFLAYKMKLRYNVSYDYCFVSGELRISKVFSLTKRKLLARLECSEMLQVGDIENSWYERLRSDPMTKEVVCTPNIEAADGKFFMYILINNDGKKLYVLECRENLLMNIMKFAKRNVLESDYVMQEKKQR